MKHLNAALICMALSAVSASAQAEVAPYTQPITINTAKHIGGFTDHFGFVRKYYVVPANLSDAQLVQLGRLLHAKEKIAWLWLLSSDEKAKQMMDTVVKTQRGDFEGYPLQWVEQNTAAHSGLHFMPGRERQWLLIKGPYSGTQLSELPCLDRSRKLSCTK